MDILQGVLYGDVCAEMLLLLCSGDVHVLSTNMLRYSRKSSR